MKVAGTLLGGAVATSLLLEAGKSFVVGLAAQTAKAADPGGHYWGFVVDANRCIGCGRCVLACKLENNVPFHADCNRTWVERYRVTTDGEMLVDSPEGGIRGFASATEAPAPENGQRATEGTAAPPTSPTPPAEAAGGEPAGMAERILAIAADMRARLPYDFFDIEHGELLYDEDGLPR